MCFSPKMKVPKSNTTVPAPEPIPLEAPKGIDFGGESSGAEGEDTDDETSVAKTTRIDREATAETPSALSTVKSAPNTTSSKKTKAYLSSRNVKKAMSKSQ
jgi:hypothetical protein